MAGVTVRMDDLNRLVATLTDKTNGMDSRSSLIVRKAAHDVEAYAKQYVPVDTGFLKNSIHTVITANKWRVYAAEIVADANYAGFVEHGTSRMAPQPYLQPALDRVMPGFLAALESIANPLS
jgi:HK97 gp10 family phage protein